MHQVYLTRRNLLTLLAKLDAKKEGFATARTIVKNDVSHPKFPCTEITHVTALENEEYYDRAPGAVHPREETALALRT